MKAVLLLAACLSVSLAAPALAADAKPQDPAVAMLTHPELVDQLFAGFGSSISKADPSVVRIFVYREKRKDPYPELNTIIENRIIDELIQTNRFKVVYCRECSVPHIESTRTTFTFSNTIDSDAALAALAHRLGVDGVLMWNTLGTGRNVIVTFKLIRANDGAIIWSKHFETEPLAREKEQAEAAARKLNRDRMSGLYLYGGLQGFNTSRQALPGSSAASQFVAQGLDIGLVLARQSSFLDDFAYGLEANVLQAGALNPNLSLPVVSVGPYFMLALDPLFVRGTDQRIFNLYAGAGPSFIIAQNLLNTIDFKGGMMLRFTHSLFLNLGFVDIEPNPANVVMLPDSGNNFSSTARFGGFTYDVGFGIVFQ